MIPRVVAAGLAIGVAYTLSPLFVVIAGGFALLLSTVRQLADADERRVLTLLLVVAIALRVIAVGALFLLADHDRVPFGTFFGDEEYFIKRSIWLRNLAVGIPISLADAKYAYDQSIQTSFLWFLATLHLLFGPSPYGVHLVSAFLYVLGAYMLYRTVRPGFGRVASTAGLAVLLFLPSLFVWSVSVLKEPIFFALMAGVVSITVTAARARSWPLRALAAAALLPAALVAETIREGGLVVVGAATAGGVLVGTLIPRPRLALALAIAALALALPLLGRDAVQDRISAAVARAAARHWDLVHEPGHSYMIFEPSFYLKRPQPDAVSPADAARLALGGLAAYVVVPAPWQMTSRSEIVFLPEQLAWYALVLLLPAGVWAGFRRDPFLASILFVHLAVAVILVAMTSGNIGTLVRHRALALPYVVWFSGLGWCAVVAALPGPWSVAAPYPAARQGVEG